MPDFTVRGIDISMAERIKELARAKNWSINDVVLDLLQKALEMNGSASSADAAPADHKDVALLAGTWANDEAAAFRAALEAFEQLPPDSPLASR
jgi:phosphopantetheinyl transferase (holo-ACP synthase)